MTEHDVAWSSPTGSFKLRSAGVIREGDHLLVCSVAEQDGWFLPGGKVEFGEDSAAALKRELREELHVDACIENLLLVSESMWQDDASLCHEVCFYYAVAWPLTTPPDAIELDAENKHSFLWVSFAEVLELNFQPREILPHVMEASAPLRHLVFDQRKRGCDVSGPLDGAHIRPSRRIKSWR